MAENGINDTGKEFKTMKIKDLEDAKRKCMELEERKRMALDKVTRVSVRWFDGYLEEFKCSEVRAGNYHLWMKLTSGKNRWLPNHQIRWFSID